MTMTDARPIFVDTNILVYFNLASSTFHHQAINKLNNFIKQGIELWISRQILREYMSTMSRQQAIAGKIDINALVADIRYFTTNFQIAEDSAVVSDNWLDLLMQFPSGGKQVHDVNIVATMQAYGLMRLLTHNTADFARFASVITIEPLV